MKIGTGTVYLVGAGPGDPDLITVRGIKLLRGADVIVYDRLVPRELLLQCREEAELINVGKKPRKPSIDQEEINRILIDRALQGKLVVRLKGGDPFVFGRGGEEQEACLKAGIQCLVVPGVSSALAAPASVGIPVTYREKSRHFVVVTAHSNGAGEALNYSALASIDTMVILMGRSKLAKMCKSLIAAGKDPATPAACVEWATTRKQKMTLGSLNSIATLADRDQLRPPVVTIVGEVAAMATASGSVENECWQLVNQTRHRFQSWLS
ncbi:uroporphyrinogen-III C-methyltransferase [Acidobacteria bacterium AH-259-D05]|nr:uroporphyrinogen-III C-methyltransferase [Acidobacteria bacterium AH-259-D05]